MSLANVNTFSAERFDDDRGSLVVLREGPHFPFPVREAYFIFGTHPDRPRGGHAHVTLEQVIVCAQGRCEMRFDDGARQTSVILDTPAKAVRADCETLRDYAVFAERARKGA